jgi:hypothetical protein
MKGADGVPWAYKEGGCWIWAGGGASWPPVPLVVAELMPAVCSGRVGGSRPSSDTAASSAGGSRECGVGSSSQLKRQQCRKEWQRESGRERAPHCPPVLPPSEELGQG